MKRAITLIAAILIGLSSFDSYDSYDSYNTYNTKVVQTESIRFLGSPKSIKYIIRRKDETNTRNNRRRQIRNRLFL